MIETVLLLQKFVLCKMSDESEHSDREFYDPGELSCTELVQLRTYYEDTERKPTLLTNEEVHNFIKVKQEVETLGNIFSI